MCHCTLLEPTIALCCIFANTVIQDTAMITVHQNKAYAMPTKNKLQLFTFNLKTKTWHHSPKASSLGGSKHVGELEQRLKQSISTINPSLIPKGLEVVRVDYQFQEKINRLLFDTFSDALVCKITEFITGSEASSHYKRSGEFLFQVDSFDLYQEARDRLSEGTYTVSSSMDDTSFAGPPLAVPERDEAAVRALVSLLSQPITHAGAEETMRYLKLIREFRSLLNESLLLRFQSALDSLAGAALDHPKDNAELVRLINTERNACGVSLRIKQSKPPVYLRCVASNRTKNATIQAISSGEKRETVYAGMKFPALKAGI